MEPFINDFVVCSHCKERLHVYFFPYIDRDNDSRDTEVCLSCRYERTLGNLPRRFETQTQNHRRRVETQQ